MAIQYRTQRYFNTKEEAQRQLKVYKNEPGTYIVRKHPKWKTWDIAKKVKTKSSRRSSNPFNFRLF